MDNNMELKRVNCPQCGGVVDIDNKFKSAKCPYCNCSFLIENKKSDSLYETLVIDADPDCVQNELDIYSLFGWDFKHRKNHKVEDGIRRFKNGNSRTKYKEVVQITFQREINAEWNTDELKEKSKQFFKFREEYIKNDKDFYYGFRGIAFNSDTDPKPDKYKTFAIVSFVSGVILNFIILFIAIANNSNLILILLSLLCFAIGVAFGFINLNKFKKAKLVLKKKKEEDQKKLREEFDQKQKELKEKMAEIANWAGEHMIKKYGYRIKVEFN